MAPDLLRVVAAGFLHDFQRSLYDTPETRLAHEHVVGFFGQHEAAGARERVE